jgi:ribose transport system ATP-binding protein
MGILEYRGIGKSFFGVPVLRNVSFSLPEGHILGVVGENGAGKSTLVNILGGVVQPDEGRILFRGSEYFARRPTDAFARGIAFIHQELNLFTNLSVAENLFIAGFPTRRFAGLRWIDRRRTDERAAELLRTVGLSIPPGTPVELLSQGERQLVEIAKALGMNARLIIFDEPTTSLSRTDAERLLALIGRLRTEGISVVYISHTLPDIFGICDDLLVLRDGEVVGAGPRGSFSEADLISLMVGRTLDQYYPQRTSGPTGEVALEVAGLSQPGIVENVTFKLHRGEVLGIGGLMGAGRSELARILFGLEPFSGGTVSIAGRQVRLRSPREAIRHGMAFLTDDRRQEGLFMREGVTGNVGIVALRSFTHRTGIVDAAALKRNVADLASTVRIKCANLDRQEVKTLSGGNQQKVVFAKWLLNDPSVLILDEPTRGIDIGARHEVYQLINDLAGRGTAVVLLSSDIEELIGVCDRVLVMCAGEVTDEMSRAGFDRERILRAALGRRAADARRPA